MFDRLISFLLEFIGLFQFWNVCRSEHRGFVRRFGVPVREVPVGLSFIWPFRIETVTEVDMRLWADVLPAQSLRTKDGVEFVIRLMVSYQPVNPHDFVFKAFDATNNIQDIAAGALGAAMGKATAEDVDSGKVLRRVRSSLTASAKPWGVSIQRVQFADCTRASSYRLFGATKDEN
jgi:regulator of protease activity HflC (stomatin/prohibitin superfamily)